MFLRFLELLGVQRDVVSYRLSIHGTADIPAATEWWSDVVDVPAEAFRRPTLKHHKPVTVRRNVADGYHGCLVVRVPAGAALYWRMEGMMRGIAVANAAVDTARMSART